MGDEFAHPEVFDLLRNVAPEKTDRRKINAKALGRWIARNARTIADGMRFVQAPAEHKTAVWWIEKVQSGD